MSADKNHVELIKSLDLQFDRRPQPDLVPTASVAVLEGHELTVVAWGADPLTLFQAASTSKPVAAFAALRLVASGQLGLDVDLNSLLSNWQLRGDTDWTPTVTLRQLLTHGGATTVAGFPGYRRADPLPTLEQILDGTPPANTGPIRVRGIPGLTTRYSGGGFMVVQKVLEDVTHTSFAQLANELVLQPAGMTSATFEQPLSAESHKRAAVGHVGGRGIDGGWYIYPELAAAGLWCTPTDLVRLAAAVQASIRGDSGALLPQHLAELMISPQYPGVALGFGTRGSGPNRHFGHTGGNQGYRCAVLGSATEPTSAAVMTNSDEGYLFVRGVLDSIASIRNWPAPFATPLMLERFDGEFATSTGSQIRVERRGEDLTISLLEQPPISLKMEGDRKATTLDPALSVTIDYDLEGFVSSIVICQLEEEVVAYPVHTG